MILAFQVVRMFFPAEGTALYGNRLDGIEEVELSNNKLNKIASALEDNESVKEASVSVQGKIIEVIITAQDDTTVDAVKGLNTIILDALNKDEKGFYDIQIFVTKDTDASDFPIIGYKHYAKDDFSWTKDRGTE